MTNNSNSVRKSSAVQREERRKIVAANLLAGLNYRDISSALNVSLGTISNDVKVLMGRWQKEQLEAIEENIRLDLRRIDVAINAIWEDVKAGDIRAIGALIQLQDRRAKLIGMDKLGASDVMVLVELEKWKETAERNQKEFALAGEK